jgi:hypothetical protein
MSYRVKQADRALQAADPGHGLAESHQIIALKLLSSSEVVDDLGDRSASLGMAQVVRELIVFDHRAIFIFASRRS